MNWGKFTNQIKLIDTNVVEAGTGHLVGGYKQAVFYFNLYAGTSATVRIENYIEELAEWIPYFEQSLTAIGWVRVEKSNCLGKYIRANVTAIAGSVRVFVDLQEG